MTQALLKHGSPRHQTESGGIIEHREPAARKFDAASVRAADALPVFERSVVQPGTVAKLNLRELQVPVGAIQACLTRSGDGVIGRPGVMPCRDLDEHYFCSNDWQWCMNGVPGGSTDLIPYPLQLNVGGYPAVVYW